MTDAEFRAFSARNPADTARLMKLCREHYRKRGRNSLVGWDYCRYIMLCRCGYQVGFLSEDEAWGRIMPMARAIQAAFRPLALGPHELSSWAEHADTIGRSSATEWAAEGIAASRTP